MSDLLNQASLVYIPSGYKEDTAYSVIPTDGSGDLTFTRASDGTRVNSQGLIERVPWNLLSNSQVFSLWNKVQIGSTITVTDNFTTAPNGSLTAAKVVFSTFDGTAQIFQNYSLGTTQIYTSSLYAKVPSGTKQAYFGFYDGTGKVQLKTLTTEWQRIEYTGSINSGTVRACWFYGDGGSSNVEVHLWGGQLNEGSTAKPYFPTTDRLNVPRLDYSGGCPSLLLEPQRTNLVTYSEQFDNGAWSKTETSVTANNGTSPEGYTNADKLIPTTANTYHETKQAFSGLSGSYTISAFFKASGYDYAFVRSQVNAGSDRYAVIVNLTNGTAYTNSTGSPTGTSYKVDNYGSGWFRLSVTATTNNYLGITIGPANGSTFGSFSLPATFSGNGTDGILAWGAQAEAGSYPTSYIPTTSASVTRVADAASKTGISSLIGQTEGTLFVECSALADDATNRRISLSDGTTTNSMYVSYKNYTNQLRVEVISSGSSVFDYTYSMADITQVAKIALAYKANDFAFYLNGSQIAVDTSGAIPSSLSRFGFDNGASGSNFYGKVNQAALFKTRLTNTELAALTTL